LSKQWTEPSTSFQWESSIGIKITIRKEGENELEKRNGVSKDERGGEC